MSSSSVTKRRWLWPLSLVVIVPALLWIREEPADDRGDATTAEDSSPENDTPSPEPAPSTRPEARVTPLVRRTVAPSTVRSIDDPGVEAGAVSGRVLDDTARRPLAGATLHFERGSRERRVTTASDGTFFFAPGEAGEHRLTRVDAPGYEPFSEVWGDQPIRFWLASGQRLDGIDVPLAPRRERHVRVLDSDGSPVSDARVYAFGLGFGGPAVDARSGGDGVVSLALPPMALIEATHPERGSARVVWDPEAMEEELPFEIRLVEEAPATGQIGGIVRGPDGEPVPHARVCGQREIAGDDESAPVLWARADRLGAFQLTPTTEGRYQVTAEAAGLARSARASIRAGTRVATIHLSSENRIRLVLRDTDGAPILAAGVHITSATPAEAETLATLFGYSSDGRYTIGGLAAGSYRVSVSSPGYRTRSVEVAAEVAPEETEIQLDRGATLRGRVVSNAGDSVSDANVLVEWPIAPNASALRASARATTDAEGRFQLSGPSGGTAVLTIAAGDGTRSRREISVPETGASDLGTLTPDGSVEPALR